MIPGATERIAFTVHYDGNAFYGWQVQRAEPSVQGELERVLSRLFDRPVRVIGSGRTDRGVHSVGQVAAVDAPPSWEPLDLRRAMNALLPESIWVAGAARVDGDFHPRYTALSRSYTYRLGLAEHSASPFLSRWCWPLRRDVDTARMEVATATLIGDHSFRAFAKAGQEERGDRCIVEEARWLPWEGVGLEFHVTANRFLHHMVRYLVGTLVEIGLGRRSPDEIGRLLAGDPELETSPPAPAEGLYLTRVRYPPGAYAPEPPDAATGSIPSTIL